MTTNFSTPFVDPAVAAFPVEAFAASSATGPGPVAGGGTGPVVGREVNVITGSSGTGTGQTGAVQDADGCCNSCS